MGLDNTDRRSFLRYAVTGTAGLVGLASAKKICSSPSIPSWRPPNLLYVFADQWRAQAVGYAGDPNVRTPHIDRLSRESINFSNAVSGCPVCSPYRASLITGRYPLTTGVFLNDVHLNEEAVSMAQAFNGAGYSTGWIGKWHIDGYGRGSFIPRERRRGFRFWKAMECTHEYNGSYYYGDDNKKLQWDGYDAIAQTAAAADYIREHADGDPFALFLSWGPPHDPYLTAPKHYRNIHDQRNINLRSNVPGRLSGKASTELAGYYSHIAALDDCIGSLVETLGECNIADNTIFVFTSDHGDMLWSQGEDRKQKPWDESIRIPFLLRYPALRNGMSATIDMPINTPDIMPTLLGLCDIGIPDTVEGMDFSSIVRGETPPFDNAAVLSCPWPFAKQKFEFRGLRTARYTYTRTLQGPWLLYDNEIDPYQMNNLCGNPQYSALEKKLNNILERRLKETGDAFLPGIEYIKAWGHVVDETGAAPYSGISRSTSETVDENRH